ncbi:proline--tRNA ligase [Natronosporangium hydrolyticum]|uniref:Proline--tRNA ligase n=1 Tax=Natronosporangium hydrolyticum TaxID=2811111 RepID=A0A895YFE8_9ACTN|nr:proline--tRNA ligase [Natronosporangium hydrolyticum]QSB14852.1 proline--tRNA ligase [Natronosporangium hydrolyticum]
MLLRMSKLFVRTLREDPADAEVPSHRLLVRAGYIRRAAPGGYAFLPLGKLVLDRIADLVRGEMFGIGGQEVEFPALLPAEPYQTSRRWVEFGDQLFRLRDRRGGDLLLAPTHEEMMTLLVKDLCSSYRDYPVTLFQIQTKFRNEARPRGGLLRGREFLMKDSYSFDLDAAGLTESYAAHRAAYQRIFDRLGLRYTVVEALSGSMGGSRSEEFLAETPSGEDTFVGCTECGYAANTEAVTTPPPASQNPAAGPPLQVHDTPDTPTIETLVAHANQHQLGGRTDWTAADTLKNVAIEVRGPSDPAPQLLVIGVPGDREVDMRRLEAVLHPASVALFEDWPARPELVRGYLGPQELHKAGVRYLVDPRVVAGSAWLTGANEPGRHATGVVCGRDFTPDSTIEAAAIRDGDPCPACEHGALEIRRGIEVGHVFQLGKRFTDAFELDASGADGGLTRITMGSYGIGISRLLATIAEQHHDDDGLVWPAAVAPCDIHLVPTGQRQLDAALTLAEELTAAGRRVLLDDRVSVSAGVKFTDAELLGIPRIVVLGRRVDEGYGELRDRVTGERRETPLTVADVLG